MLKTSRVKSLTFSIGTFCLLLINYATIQKMAQNSVTSQLRGSTNGSTGRGLALKESVAVHKAVNKRPAMHTFFEPVKEDAAA